MASADHITGEKLNSIIGFLLKDRTILRLNLLGRGYEGLTIVTGIDDTKDPAGFRIDFPGNAKDAFLDSEGSRVFFEFNGEDSLQYTFRTVVEKVAEREILIRFPDSIERIQRRRQFRVTPLSGTMVLFQAGGDAFELNVMNISQGGVLVNQGSQFHDKSIFVAGGVIKNIRVIASKESGGQIINIRKAEIRRVEKNSSTGRYQYALQFLDVLKGDDSLIKDFIYVCQREVLKKRSFISGR